jgi:hypothetical protein
MVMYTAAMTTEEEGVLARLDWAHEGAEISKAIRKLRAEGPFVPPHTGAFGGCATHTAV